MCPITSVSGQMTKQKQKFISMQLTIRLYVQMGLAIVKWLCKTLGCLEPNKAVQRGKLDIGQCMRGGPSPSPADKKLNESHPTMIVTV